MGKKTRYRTILFAVMALALALLTSSLKMPFLTNKGSGSLEVIVQAPYYTQRLAFGLLLFCLLVCFVIPTSRNKLNPILKIYSHEKPVMKVFNGFPPWQLSTEKMITVLVDLGAEVK